MPIKIKSTSGSVTLDAQNVSGDQTLTVPSQASATLQTTADTIASTRLTGTIADARFPATLPAVSGASLTNIPGPGAGTVTEAMVHADAVNVFKSGRKNLVINGGFDVWQRGTSSTVTTNVETFTADRFAYYPSGGAATISRQTFAVGQTDVPGNPKYYARVNNTTGDGWALYRQTIENPERFANKAITLSFWAKGTNPGGGKFQIYEDTYFSNVVSGTPTYTDLTVTGTWTKYSYTFNMPSHSGVTLSANDRWYFSWIQPPGDSSTAAWTLDVSQVQVEYGTTATDFEQRSYGEELALCQRYFAIVGDNAEPGDESFGLGVIRSSTYVSVLYKHSVEMRTGPSLVDITGSNTYRQNGATNGNTNGAAATIDQGYTRATSINVNGFSGMTTGQATSVKCYGGGILGLDAELT